MRIIVYRTKLNHEKTYRIMQAVADGLAKVGHQPVFRESQDFPQGDEGQYDGALCWGDTHKALDILAATGTRVRRVGHIDNGYMNRNRYEGHYSLTWGGQRQAHAYLWDMPFVPERFAALHEPIHPWRTEGKAILLLAPSLKQGNILRFEVHQWARTICDELRRYSSRPVLVRIKRYHLDEPLRDVLARESLALAIGFNTKGLVDCLLAGIPVCSLSACVTQRMGITRVRDVGQPQYPAQRPEFFARLACTQWLLSEIAEGAPFRGAPCPFTIAAP